MKQRPASEQPQGHHRGLRGQQRLCPGRPGQRRAGRQHGQKNQSQRVWQKAVFRPHEAEHHQAQIQRHQTGLQHGKTDLRVRHAHWRAQHESACCQQRARNRQPHQWHGQHVPEQKAHQRQQRPHQQLRAEKAHHRKNPVRQPFAARLLFAPLRGPLGRLRRQQARVNAQPGQAQLRRQRARAFLRFRCVMHVHAPLCPLFFYPQPSSASHCLCSRSSSAALPPRHAAETTAPTSSMPITLVLLFSRP